MFELHISDDDITGGSVAVTWCVSKETLEHLDNRGIKNPQVVLCTAPEGERYSKSKELRKVVPLKDMLAYVTFKTAGKNRIWGFIASNTGILLVKDIDEGKHVYMAQIVASDGLGYNYTRDTGVENDDSYLRGQAVRIFGNVCRVEDISKDVLAGLHADPVSVDVPAGLFAKEPPAWEKWWVNLFFSGNTVDQCDYRKRRLLAYSLQPIIMLVAILANASCRLVIFLFTLMYLPRRMSMKYLIHPLEYDMNDVAMTMEMSRGSYLFGRGENELLNAARLLLAPPLWIGLFLMTWFDRWGNIPHYLSLAGLIFVPAIFAVLIFIWIHSRFEIKRSDDRAWYMDEKELPLLLCNGDKKSTKFSDLPASKKTLKLRFFDLKNKVCRPFSA